MTTFSPGDRIQLGPHMGTVLTIHGQRGELVTVAWDGSGTSQLDTDFHSPFLVESSPSVEKAPVPA